MEIITPKGLRKIGPGQPVFIVAEMSGNHNQSLERAKKIIDAAAAAGVDAIKLQTYTADTLTIDSDKEYFQVQVNDAWQGQTLYSLYQKAYTPWEWQAELKTYGEALGLVVFSTPFDETAVDFLEALGVALHKVASFEIGDLELLAKIGQTKKPVIISRGLASLEEIAEAIKVLQTNGAPAVAVLHCVSSYPATIDQMNLATIADLQNKFKVVVGLSDHTVGLTAALTSVALGASIIEKHFTLQRSDGGPDAAFSLEPAEMTALVKSVREAEAAIGTPTYDIGAKEGENKVFKRSLFVVKDIKAGEILNKDNIRCIRPGYGLPPRLLPQVLGQRASHDLFRGEPLKAGDYDNEQGRYLELYHRLLVEAPEKSDVLVWLQGDRLDRGGKILALYQQGFSSLILLSGNDNLIGPDLRPGEDNVSLGEMKQWLIGQGVPADNIMIDSQSFNTKEQSINIIKLALVKQWQKIIIVSSAYYQPRAFLTFVKTAAELDYQGTIISQAVAVDLNLIPSGRTMPAGQLLITEAEKVKIYQAKGDLAAYEEAENYLKRQAVRVNILVDNPDSWIMPFAKQFSEQLAERCLVNFVSQQDELVAGDIAIFLSCEQIVSKANLAKNKHNLVVHASALPQGRGWSPLTWQILEGKNSIPLTLFEAEEKVDRGRIYSQEYVDFEGHELIDELRNQLGEKIIEMLEKFIDSYLLLAGHEQVGEPSYYKRRSPAESELNMEKSLAEQFNLFRVADNEKYPVFFNHQGHKYILKIYRNKNNL